MSIFYLPIEGETNTSTLLNKVFIAVY